MSRTLLVSVSYKASLLTVATGTCLTYIQERTVSKCAVGYRFTMFSRIHSHHSRLRKSEKLITGCLRKIIRNAEWRLDEE